MTAGLHHVTAIAGPAARNRAFHATVLGQRLVKRTVNFDDPTTYHLYYGDANGTPGSILTFFPWSQASPGRLGVGETAETAFRVPVGALPFWADRLGRAGISVDATRQNFGGTILPFADPDGMRFALVEMERAANEPAWETAGLAPDHALRGLHGVTLAVDDPNATAAILTDVLGFRAVGTEGATQRFAAPGAGMGDTVDLVTTPGGTRGRQGAGTVHHVAFRAADDAAQAAMADRLRNNHGLNVTEQRDRNYFRAVYFREPNGVLFEIATDAPGFAVDEPQATLGEALKLPEGLEPMRERIAAVLPALD